MEDKSISEILTVLNQMEAEDRAEDAQRRGRAKIKVVFEGFARMQKEIPALESKKKDVEQKIAGLDSEYQGKRSAKQKEIDALDLRLQGQQDRFRNAKSKADEMDKTVANKDTKLAEVEKEYKAEVAKWDKAIFEKKEELEKVERAFISFQKRHGLAATG